MTSDRVMGEELPAGTCQSNREATPTGPPIIGTATPCHLHVCALVTSPDKARITCPVDALSAR